MAIRRGAKAWGKRRLRTVLEVGQRLGVDVLPRHFYSEIPDLRQLRRERRWQRPYSLTGVRGTDLDAQLDWLQSICPPELTGKLPSLKLHERAGEANGAVGYGPVESDILYCLLRTRAPRRMIQIGAGASTWIALQAAQDSGTKIGIACVDPFPTDFLRRLDREGQIELISKPVQAVPPEELSDLGSGDVLFIDSTHTVSPGSDVNYVILEVLPRLAEGVLVHFHDITMPFDYTPSLLSSDLFFWTESVLLHAYLADNPRFRIRLGCAMLHESALDRARAIIPTYDPPLRTEQGLASGHEIGVFPSAMWLEVVAPPS